MSILIDHAKLQSFCQRVFESLGVSPDDAAITAEVLVASDLRGWESHGVARLGRYVDGLKSGTIKADAKPTIENDSPATAAIDAHDGLGQPASKFAMELVIDKAKKFGVGVATVKNSNHYGIAGYYAMMALRHGLIGISTTNTNPLVVPTFGAKMIMGTNPIAFAAPAGEEKDFVFDAATSTVPRGKLEVYARKEQAMPVGWAVDETGASSTDPVRVLDNMIKRTGGGLTPLGGEGEEFGGHKGYGLSLLLDVLAGVLSGSAYADYVGADPARPANVGHFFLALDPGHFFDRERFKQRIDKYIRFLHESPKAAGRDRIFVPGEQSFELTEQHKKSGIPMIKKVVENLKKIGENQGVACEIEA